MFTKTITYTDFDENERTETFMFNLNEMELMEFSRTEDGEISFLDQMQGWLDAKNVTEILLVFQRLIAAGIGIKSPDGRYFVHEPEYRDRFLNSAAYAALIRELLQSENAAIVFFNALMPAGLQTEIVPVESHG